MAVKHWHPGQFVVFLAGGLLAWWVAWKLIEEIDEPYTPLENVAMLTSVLIFFLLPVIALIVAWKWFGSRNRRNSPPPTISNQDTTLLSEL